MIKFSTSVESYKDKTDVGAAIGPVNDTNLKMVRERYGRKKNHKISFNPQEATPWDLYQLCLNGHTFCHVFGGFPTAGINSIGQHVTYQRKDGSFSMSAKCNEFFLEAWCIVADMDYSTAPGIAQFLDSLPIKPTFWYTTFSHTPQHPRFRLVYCLDTPLTNATDYRQCAKALSQLIISCTGDVPDPCAENVAQYFNPTNIKNTMLCIEHGFAGTTYQPLQFMNLYQNYFNNNNNNSNNNNNNNNSSNNTTPHTHYLSIMGNNTYIDNDMLHDIDRLDYDQYLYRYAPHYNYYYMPNMGWWIDDEYQWAQPGWFRLPFYPNKIQDGHHRRHKVFLRMCLRRILDPTADVNRLIFCARIDVGRQFDETDGVFNADYYRRNALKAMSYTLNDIEEQMSDTLALLRSHAPKDRIVLRPGLVSAPSQAHTKKKEIRYRLIDALYDSSLTPRQNLFRLQQQLPFPLSQSVLYRYTQERGICA